MQPHRMTVIALPTPPSSFTAAFVFLIAVLIVPSVQVLHYASFLSVFAITVSVEMKPEQLLLGEDPQMQRAPDVVGGM